MVCSGEGRSLMDVIFCLQPSTGRHYLPGEKSSKLVSNSNKANRRIVSMLTRDRLRCASISEPSHDSYGLSVYVDAMICLSLRFSSSPPNITSILRPVSVRISVSDRPKCLATRRYSFDNGLPNTPTSSVCPKRQLSDTSSEATKEVCFDLRIAPRYIHQFSLFPGC